ncbi:nucleotidyltransferase family protein [Pigmentiphaga aceris]|uniref:Nucleotidyltransferase family protein n=1 Tax=Pigmentiphaga aceris TaxID=1940612 RepID=A0A5C0AYX5_9BURK|nr:nucleotidyltransferase family protein [Pigmentiphaga aceris]QEI05791.1 nucleotidyltransferase family protein [Pigmentiphaga aceris]
MSNAPVTTIGILLAAGLGSRFNAVDPAAGSKLKACLPDGRPIALASAQNLLKATTHVLAVVRSDQDPVADLLRNAGCKVLASNACARGMGASIAAAAQHLLVSDNMPDAAGAYLIALADMPWVLPDTLAQLADLSHRHAVTAPVYQGQRGHPVGFAAALLPALATLDGDTGARTVLANHAVHLLACDDPGVLRDVDTPADLNPTNKVP